MMLKFYSLALASAQIMATTINQNDPSGMLQFLLLKQYGQAYLDQISNVRNRRQVSEEANEAQEIDNFISELKQHGCQCAKLFNHYDESENLFDSFVGGNTALDEIDTICRSWLRARRCIEKLENGSCYSYGSNYGSLEYELKKSGAISMGYSEYTCVLDGPENYGKCQTDTCQIDLRYASEMIEEFQKNDFWQQYLDSGVLDFNPVVVSEFGVCPYETPLGAERICEGNAPNVNAIIKPKPVYKESIFTNANYDYLPINFPDTVLDGVNGVTSGFTFEVEIKAKNDAHILFCEDQKIDPRNNPPSQNNKCMELVIGGWGNGRSIFRGSPQNHQNSLSPFMSHNSNNPRPLDPRNFRLFKISFTENGDIQVFRVSDAKKQLEYNNLPRNVNGVLTDDAMDSYDTDYFYDETPWMERKDWVNFVGTKISSVKSIGFATGWGSTGQWNVMAV